jgi:hypothetical protein
VEQRSTIAIDLRFALKTLEYFTFTTGQSLPCPCMTARPRRHRPVTPAYPGLNRCVQWADMDNRTNAQGLAVAGQPGGVLLNLITTMVDPRRRHECPNEPKS